MNTTELTKLEVYYQHEIGRNIDSLRYIQQNRELLEKAGIKPCFWSNYVDFDGVQRPDVLKILRVFGGKWDKTPSYDGGYLTYTRRGQIGGRTVRISGEPPASCKIVEKVTYKRIPARRERVVTRTVVCSDGTTRKLS
jgi:hypothetical protein